MTPTSQIVPDARDRARRALRGSGAFAHCADTVIDEIVARAVAVKLARGDVVYRQGELGDSLMVLLSGSLKVTNVTAEGKEIVLGFLKPGALFGEIAALDGRERTANVVALEPCEAVAIYRRDLLPVLRGNPDAMMALMEGLCARVRSTIRLVESHSLETAARVADGLVRLAEEHGQPSGKATTIDLRLTQRDLGGHLGLTRETVSRTLGDFREAGLVEISGATILIIDMPGLIEIATGGDA